MKECAIDVGSNSVRILLSEDGATTAKKVIITRLSERLSETGVLCEAAQQRTLDAIKKFCALSEEYGADKLYIFATCAVRSASNGADFCMRVLGETGIKTDVVSGETEARLAVTGALGNRDGGVIDAGGASTEIAVVKHGKIIYSKSVNAGAVVLKDICGRNYAALDEYTNKIITEYGIVPSADFYAVGGTATSLSAIKQSLAEYDASKINGDVLTLPQLEELSLKLVHTPVEELWNLKGLQKEKADVIGGGAVLLKNIVKRLALPGVRVSDSDNLEGYLIEKRKNRQEKTV